MATATPVPVGGFVVLRLAAPAPAAGTNPLPAGAHRLSGSSYIPHLLEIALTPDLVLVGFLPPLLYAAAIRTSLVDFRANRRPIGLLSVGLVAFSTLVVGATAYWVVPGLSLAAGFALGAVVAPTDAVAATTVARRVGMPRRIVSILESESLVNPRRAAAMAWGRSCSMHCSARRKRSATPPFRCRWRRTRLRSPSTSGMGSPQPANRTAGLL